MEKNQPTAKREEWRDSFEHHGPSLMRLAQTEYVNHVQALFAAEETEPEKTFTHTLFQQNISQVNLSSLSLVHIGPNVDAESVWERVKAWSNELVPIMDTVALVPAVYFFSPEAAAAASLSPLSLDEPVSLCRFCRDNQCTLSWKKIISVSRSRDEEEEEGDSSSSSPPLTSLHLLVHNNGDVCWNANKTALVDPRTQQQQQNVPLSTPSSVIRSTGVALDVTDKGRLFRQPRSHMEPLAPMLFPILLKIFQARLVMEQLAFYRWEWHQIAARQFREKTKTRPFSFMERARRITRLQCLGIYLDALTRYVVAQQRSLTSSSSSLMMGRGPVRHAHAWVCACGPDFRQCTHVKGLSFRYRNENGSSEIPNVARWTCPLLDQIHCSCNKQCTHVQAVRCSCTKKENGGDEDGRLSFSVDNLNHELYYSISVRTEWNSHWNDEYQTVWTLLWKSFIAFGNEMDNFVLADLS